MAFKRVLLFCTVFFLFAFVAVFWGRGFSKMGFCSCGLYCLALFGSGGGGYCCSLFCFLGGGGSSTKFSRVCVLAVYISKCLSVLGPK